VVLMATMLGAAVAIAGQGGLPLGSWQFGMSPDQVLEQKDFGPYKTFSNGDLETYAGTFGGSKENVQFYFKGDKLVRMLVSRYEGKDIKEAARVFGETYRILRSMYGAIETPDVITSQPGREIDPESLAIASGSQVELLGKTQMAPRKQPGNAFVFSSFAKTQVAGDTYYYVRVVYDPPRP
jgi:hypothetical protein